MNATYLLKVYTPEEGSQVGHAVVTITPELAEKIVACFEAWKSVAETLKGKALPYEASFWQSSPDFLRYDDRLRNKIRGEDYVKLPPRTRIREDLVVEGECYRLVVTDGGFSWEAYEKHTDIRLETARMEIDRAREVLAQTKKTAA